MKAALVYQTGIANVFKVESFNLAAYGREAQHIRQGSFQDCISFAQGLAAAGAQVITAHCDKAGDISTTTWTEGAGALWSDKQVEVKANLKGSIS